MARWNDPLDVTLCGDIDERLALAALGSVFFAELALVPARSMLTSRFGLLVNDVVVAVIVWISVATYAVALGDEPSAQVERQSAPITTTQTMPVLLASGGAPAT